MKNDEMMDERFDDPRLSAYALGELEGEEREAVERLLAKDAELREFVDELAQTAGFLSTELAGEQTPGLTEEQRTRIEREAGGRPSGIPRLVKIAAIGVTGLAAAAVAVVGVTNLMAPADDVEVARFEGSTRELNDLAEDSAAAAPSERPLMEQVAEDPAAPPPPSEARPEGTVLAELERALPKKAELRQHDQGNFRYRRALEGLGYSTGEAQFEQPLSTEEYHHIQEADFIPVAVDPLSTFSIDVDTGAYANVRRFLNQGQLPPPDAVRIEELVNYFAYAYPEPNGDEPFSVSTEVAPCPWQPDHRLVRIGLKGREVHPFERKPANLVFLLDVSGSMNNAQKLPLLKSSMRLLIENLNRDDRVAIVVYAGAAGLVLPSTPASNGAAILSALERLQAGGSTNGGAGIDLAYRIARENFREGGINRVILATDGDFNVGTSSEGDLVRMVQERAASGVFLTILGFGQGNLKDSRMEQIANKGNGVYNYIDSENEARKVLVRELGGTLDTIAKDVKIQVEMNPARVAGYRLIGYENRKLAHQDFTDDTKDAGEIGAGHRVTALYEIVPVGVEVPRASAGTEPDLTYQQPGELTERARSGELMTVKLRFKEPDGERSRERAFQVRAGEGAPSADMQFAAAVALFGMKLRGSEHSRSGTFEQVFELSRQGMGDDLFGYRAEFVQLVQRAIPLAENR